MSLTLAHYFRFHFFTIVPMSKSHYVYFFLLLNVLSGCGEPQSPLSLDSLSDWESYRLEAQAVSIQKSNDQNGVIDLMGNGGLMLAKADGDHPFQKTTEFQPNGLWTSTWREMGHGSISQLEYEVLTYGNPIDMDQGWVKFSGNPVLSGENTLLPLNRKNITPQTLLLPEPGGVPQDQSILKGTGLWADKWLLFFNHTPHKWPFEYYWSFVVADSLSPLKAGLNPFYIDSTQFPLYGPIDGQAPNDWLEVNGIFYAPDETHDGESHMWQSKDIVNWEDLGPISGILGADPGMVFDGNDFFLFNENGDYLTYNRLDENMTQVVEGDTVLHVGDHTGDPDIGFFNNQWHMFFDDGEHLHYNIGYAVTHAEDFPYGWELTNDIYGPYKPDQGQTWDDDNKAGNDFGTGDADIALENTTLYMFTERPIGVAYRELNEVYTNTGQLTEIKLETDHDGDGKADDATDWLKLETGAHDLSLDQSMEGKRYRILLRLSSDQSGTSPLVRYLRLK